MTITPVSSNISFLERSTQAKSYPTPARVSTKNSLSMLVSFFDPAPLIKYVPLRIFGSVTILPTTAPPAKAAAIVARKIALFILVSSGSVVSSYLLLTRVALISAALIGTSPIKSMSLLAAVSGWILGAFFNISFPIIYSADMRGKPFDLFRMTPSNFRDCKLYLIQTAVALGGGAAIPATLPLSLPLLTYLFMKSQYNPLKNL